MADEANAQQRENSKYRTLKPSPEKARNDLLQHLESGLSISVRRYFLAERSPHGQSYSDYFNKFSEQEARLSGKPASHLVKGSGGFSGTAALEVFGNYPTFYTDTSESGECADPTNPCMRMLLKKGLRAGYNKAIDMWDRWHRREHTAGRNRLRRDQDIWWQSPEDIKKLHDQHTDNTLMLSHPLVILAVGTPAQKWIARKETFMYSLMVGSVRVQIHLNSGDVERLVVGCPHPETMFFPHSAFYGRLMDEVINFAIEISGLTDELILDDYFTRKGTGKENPAGQWHLRGQESRVILVARMRNFEKETGVQLDMAQIPQVITRAYAGKLGVSHSAASLQRTLKAGQTLVGAILESYTRASHAAMEAKHWPNLRNATNAQAAGGWRSLRKAVGRSMAGADAARFDRNESPRVREVLTCPNCSAAFRSR